MIKGVIATVSFSFFFSLFSFSSVKSILKWSYVVQNVEAELEKDMFAVSC